MNGNWTGKGIGHCARQRLEQRLDKISHILRHLEFLLIIACPNESMGLNIVDLVK